MRRRGILILVGGVVAAAALVVAVVFGPTAWEIMKQRDARLTTPAETAGLRLDDSDRAKQTADYLRTALAADLALDDTVGAVYTDGSRSIIIFGGTGSLRTPSRDLDRAFKLLADDGSAVEDLRTVPPGELGGLMKCGTTSDMTVCGWADHGSLAVAMFPGRTIDEAAELLRTLRSTIQHRS